MGIEADFYSEAARYRRENEPAPPSRCKAIGVGRRCCLEEGHSETFTTQPGGHRFVNEEGGLVGLNGEPFATSMYVVGEGCHIQIIRYLPHGHYENPLGGGQYECRVIEMVGNRGVVHTVLIGESSLWVKP